MIKCYCCGKDFVPPIYFPTCEECKKKDRKRVNDMMGELFGVKFKLDND
jgi:hypothetical protein